jgi:hypothetical protein
MSVFAIESEFDSKVRHVLSIRIRMGQGQAGSKHVSGGGCVPKFGDLHRCE